MSKKDPKSITVLSIDGGGILGLYSANILKHMQEDLFGGTPFSEHFDLVTGTSTGGIIALGLASGRSAEDIVDFYCKYGGCIFPKKSFVAQLIGGLTSGIYSNRALTSCLDKFFKKTKVSECAMKFCIPSIDVSEGKSLVFKTNNSGTQTRDDEVLLKDIALATSAAPIYLPMHTFGCYSALADGGLWQNNPSLIGLIEALTSMNAKSVKVLSIGNPLSKIKESVVNKENRNGFFSWHKKLVTLPMKVSSNATDYIMNILLRNQSMNLDRYLRIVHNNIADQNRDLSMDNASESAMNRLIELSDKDYNEYKEKILNFFKEEE